MSIVASRSHRRRLPVYLLNQNFGGNQIDTGIWTPTDTETKISVSGGWLVFSGGKAAPGFGDPASGKTVAYTRKAGLTFQCKVQASATDKAVALMDLSNVLALSADAHREHSIFLGSAGVVTACRTTTNTASGITYSADTDKYLRIVLLATGALYYASDDGVTWKLFWEDTAGTATPLYPVLWTYNGACKFDYFRPYQSTPKPAVVSDTFTRDDSALTLGNAETGQAWTAVAGTWGISSNKAYSASDADADMATIPGVADGIIDCTVSGQLMLAAGAYRLPAIVCRYGDASNFLIVDLFNGTVRLLKRDADIQSVITSGVAVTSDGTDYTLRIVMIGTAIKVYLDGVEKISYTLAGGDTKYTAYSSCGLRLVTGGAPATAARWDGFKVQA